MINQTNERTIQRWINELCDDGFLTIEITGPKRKIRVTAKLAEIWNAIKKNTVIEEVTEGTGTAAPTKLPMNESEPKGSTVAESVPYNNSTVTNSAPLPRQNLYPYRDEFCTEPMFQTLPNAMDGKPSGTVDAVPNNIINNESNNKQESEAFASLVFVPVVSQKKERKPYQTKKRKAQSNVPLTEEDVKFRLALKPIIEHKDFLPAWNAFKENCHAKRSPVSDARKELLLKDLLQFSGGNPAKAISILQETVKGGWSKFYAPKYNAGKNTVFLQDRPPEERIKKVVWGQKIKP